MRDGERADLEGEGPQEDGYESPYPPSSVIMDDTWMVMKCLFALLLLAMALEVTGIV